MQIIIQHVSGSKANQIDQFDTDKVTEISLGREPSCTVVFDAHRDDAVSRRHAVIKVVEGDGVSVRLTDMGSLNGTKVNGQRITQETELSAESLVQLGNGGPEFIVNFSPRDAANLKATRILTPATRMVGAGTVQAPPPAASNVMPSAVASPSKPSVGRETVMGMLLAQRRTVSRQWIYISAAIVAVMMAGGGGLYWQMNKTHQAATTLIQESEKRTESQLADQLQATEASRQQTEELKQKIGMSPDAIVRQFENSVARITIRGHYYDHGKPVYQKVFMFNKVRYPAFVRLDDNTLVRWLTYENDKMNLDMGYNLQGSGFVISEDGFLLTVRHVARPSSVRFAGSHSLDGLGFVFKVGVSQRSVDGTVMQGPMTSMVNQRGADKLVDWKAGDKTMIFDNKSPTMVTSDLAALEARDDAFEVQFPDVRFANSARFVRGSAEADIALIKVDVPQKLTPLRLAPRGTKPDVGSAITVVGYPAVSMQTLHVEITSEGGPPSVHDPELIPHPTAIPGSIARRGERFQQRDAEFVTGTLGDVYELNAAASAGSSGSPVFDQQGDVVGVLTYSAEREATTFAVPISYGQVLVQ